MIAQSEKSAKMKCFEGDDGVLVERSVFEIYEDAKVKKKLKIVCLEVYDGTLIERSVL